MVKESMSLIEANNQIMAQELNRIQQEHQEIKRLHQQQEQLLHSLVAIINEKQSL